VSGLELAIPSQLWRPQRQEPAKTNIRTTFSKLVPEEQPPWTLTGRWQLSALSLLLFGPNPNGLPHGSPDRRNAQPK
jgi:hypothetical protein